MFYIAINLISFHFFLYIYQLCLRSLFLRITFLAQVYCTSLLTLIKLYIFRNDFYPAHRICFAPLTECMLWLSSFYFKTFSQIAPSMQKRTRHKHVCLLWIKLVLQRQQYKCISFNLLFLWHLSEIISSTIRNGQNTHILESHANNNQCQNNHATLN